MIEESLTWCQSKQSLSLSLSLSLYLLPLLSCDSQSRSGNSQKAPSDHGSLWADKNQASQVRRRGSFHHWSVALCQRTVLHWHRPIHLHLSDRRGSRDFGLPIWNNIQRALPRRLQGSERWRKMCPSNCLENQLVTLDWWRSSPGPRKYKCYENWPEDLVSVFTADHWPPLNNKLLQSACTCVEVQLAVSKLFADELCCVPGWGRESAALPNGPENVSSQRSSACIFRWCT